MLRLLLLTLLLLVPQSCGGLRFFAPDNPIEESGILDLYRDSTSSEGVAELVGRYRSSDCNDEKKALRNEVVAGLALLIDNEYEYFATRMLGVRAFVNTGLDTTAGGLAIASTLVNHVDTGKLLAGIGAGILGLRLSIDKEFFYEQSSPILVAQMDQDREAAFASIKAGLSMSATEYPMAVAVRDVGKYYQAGTLVHAFAELGKRVNSGPTTAGLAAIPRLTVKSLSKTEVEIGFSNPAVAGKSFNITIVGYKDVEGKDEQFRKTLIGTAGDDGSIAYKLTLPDDSTKRLDIAAPTSTPLIFFTEEQ